MFDFFHITFDHTLNYDLRLGVKFIKFLFEIMVV